MKSKLILILLLVSMLPMTQTSAEKINVVTSTTILADVAKNVGGDLLEVNSIIGIGVNPHSYQATPSDTVLLSSADVIFFNGGGVEEGMEETLHDLETAGKAFAVNEFIPEEKHLTANSNDDHDHDYDPHYWEDPTLMIFGVEMMRDQLISLDANNALTYTENAANYINQLNDVDSRLQAKIDELPENQKFLVTQHNGFQYLGNRYGLTTQALEGISTNDEAGVSEVDALAKYLKDNQIKVVFIEETVPEDQMQAVIEAAGAIGWTVVIGGSLVTGSLSTGEASTYIGKLETNINLIVSNTLNPPEAEDVPLQPFWIFLSLAVLSSVRRKRNL
ncbi:MAG: zinc ABC transporter substrate-binding protein [Candidatus Heimdallarchaeota archaeon]|nr:zinc ABC transporter substrate-binding protein [Candidatus Heimdallarchaeota archaeon]